MRNVQTPKTLGNLLVTSAASKVPLLQAVTKSLLKTGSTGKLIAGDSNGNCLARYFVEDFWHMPSLGVLTDDVLLAELKRREVRYIIPTRDGELSFWSERREWLQREEISVMVSAPEAVAACIDKLEFYRFCQPLGIPAIATALKPEDLMAERFVVKERNGAGAQHIGINLKQEQARQHAKNLEQPVFQPFVAGTEYSVDAYVNQRGQVKGVICRTRDLVINGESQVTTTVRMPELEMLCASYIKQLRLFGHIIMQLIVDDRGRPWLIECNARFGGASTLSIAAGLDSFYWFLLEMQGQDLSKYPFLRSKKQLQQVRYPHDVVQEVD